MATIIRPLHSVYSPVGPAPSFDVEVTTGRLYEIELASDPILFNGANARSRAPRNFFSSFDGSKTVPPETTPATASVFTYTVPAAMWGILKRVPLLYYRLLSFAAGRRALETTLPDLDYESAPFVLVSARAAGVIPLAEITPVLDGVFAAGPPPSFDIRAGTQLFYGVELATDPQLFVPRNVYQRNHDNFFSSFLGMQGTPAAELETADGSARYDVPLAVWDHLRGGPSIYYRAISARSVQGLGAVYSVDDPNFALAPALTVGQITAAAVAEIDHRDARLLGRNPPPAMCVRGDGNTHFEIELATSTALLAAAGGRSAGVNYFSTSAVTAIGGVVIAAATLALVNGVGTYVVPPAVWQSLGRAQFIFYRVTTFRLAAGVRANVATSPAPVGIGHRMPGLWGGVPVDSSTAGAYVNALGELVTGNLSSDHGPRALAVPGRVWHPGIDVPVNGIPIHAVADGTIDLIHASLGRVRVDHGAYKTSYLHMHTPFATGIAVGAAIRRGQQLGTANATGTPGPHLHFELEHGGKNPLSRVRHTERATPPGIAPGATLGPDFSPGSAATNGAERFTVEMKATIAGMDDIAILGVGVSTASDKDLMSVDIRVLTEFAVDEPDNRYFLDYSAVNSVPNPANNQMLSVDGTEAPQTPRMVFGGSSRAAGLPALTANTRREFFIMQAPAGAVGLPQPFYAPLRLGANVGAHRAGQYDMYLIPGFTNAGLPSVDWFNYMWHVTPYTDDTGPHRLLVLATDLKGNSMALEEPFGVAVTAISGVTTRPGTAVVIQLRVQLLDNRGGNVELTISGVLAGWAAVGSWPVVGGVGSVVLAAGGSAMHTVTITPSPAAAAGTVADIKVVARSARLRAFRDSVTIRATVGVAPPAPQIVANAPSVFRLSLPPFFRVETGADVNFAVELSDALDFHEGTLARNEFVYFNSRVGIPGVPAVELVALTGVALYELPRIAWERLVALPSKEVYYRVLTAPDATWGTLHRSAPSLLTIVPDWPIAGPTIEPLHGLDAPALVIPPAFRLHVARNFYYCVEVATDPLLFDDDVKRRDEHTFFSSWFGSSLIPPRPLTAPSGYAVYHVPEPVWGQMRQELVAGRAVQLHYIVRQARIPAELFGTIHSSSLAHIA